MGHVQQRVTDAKNQPSPTTNPKRRLAVSSVGAARSSVFVFSAASHRAVSSGARSGEAPRKGRHREWTEARNAAGVSRRGGKREQRRYSGGRTRRAVSSAPTAGARRRRSGTAAGRSTATARHAQKAAARERRSSRAGGRRRRKRSKRERTRGRRADGREGPRATRRGSADRGRRRRRFRRRVGTERATKRMGNGAFFFLFFVWPTDDGSDMRRLSVETFICVAVRLRRKMRRQFR